MPTVSPSTGRSESRIGCRNDLAWTLLYARVHDVRLLDGGLAAWQRAGFDVVQAATPAPPKSISGRITPSILKSLQEVELMWAANGITRDKHVAFYCGTAWRSSLAFFYAYQMGWPRISNFDSSWYEWSMGPEAAQNPVE